MSSGPTIGAIYQWLTERFATRFANRFAKQRLARHQPHHSIHALYSQTQLRCFTGVELGVVDVVMVKDIHELPGGCLGFREINAKRLP